jgi:hypothetical protein
VLGVGGTRKDELTDGGGGKARWGDVLSCRYFVIIFRLFENKSRKFSVSDVWRERKEMKAASFRIKADAMAAWQAS